MNRFRSLLCLLRGGHLTAYYFFGRCPRCGALDSIRRRVASHDDDVREGQW